MLSKILSTATIIVVAWIAMQLVHTQQALSTVQGALNESLASVRTDLSDSAEQSELVGADILKRMDELAAEQVKLAKSASKPDPKLMKEKNQTITRLTQAASLKDIVVDVLKADLHSKNKQGEKASEVLLSTKSRIWKLSGKWGKSKDALRGLMAPVDILAGKWKRGDFSSDTESIQKVLQEVLATQTQS